MKNLVLEKGMSLVKSSYPDYDSDMLDRIRYGLESLYLSITKLIVIFSIAYLLNILKQTILLFLAFNILRSSGFGLHASKSWMCWVSSSLIFLIIPYLCSVVIISKNLLIFLALACEFNLLLFAPADTVKRPLINAHKRKIWKFITGFSGIIFTYFILKTNDTMVQNILLSAMIIESALVNPVVYKIFHLSYNNYKSYVYSTK